MKKYLAISTIILVTVISILFLLKHNDQYYKITVDILVEKPTFIGVFYNNERETFDEYKALYHPNADTLNYHKLSFELNKEWKTSGIIVDFGEPKQLVRIRSLNFKDKSNEVQLLPINIYKKMAPNDYIISRRIENEILELECQKGNPYFLLNDIVPYLNELSQKYALYNKLIKLLSLLMVLNLIIGIILISIIKIRKPNKNYKGSNVIFVVLFFFILAVPLNVYYFSPEKYRDEQEKRILAKKFAYSGQLFSGIIDELETYFLDHFGLRSEMIKAWCYINYRFFDVSAIPSKVQVGDAGWLYAHDYAEITQVYRFQEKELEIIRNNAEEKALWLKSRNIKYYMVLVPSKPTILFEHLPPVYANKAKPSLLDQVVVALSDVDNLEVIDLREPLFKAKEEVKEDIFFRSDTHWNNYGGYYAYKYIMNCMNNHFKNLVPYDISDYNIKPIFDYEGDLYKSLAITNQYKRFDFQFKLIKPSPVTEDKPLPNEIDNSMFYTNQNEESPKLLMIRDSYGVALVPFMIEHFERSAFLWNHKFEPDILDYEKPNIFIHERLEVYLRDLLTPNDPRIIQEVKSIRAQ